MTFPGMQVELTNWSKSTRSACYVYQVRDTDGISAALAAARARGLSAIPHGAGHSYTDAALNSGGVVIDLTPMRRILSWDPERGVLRVEPGVTMREMVQATWRDGWWPVVSPSTPEVTVGGCAAMNVNGRNAWKCGPFGSTILSLDVLLPNGEPCSLGPERDPDLFHAFVGSMGLLGIVTSITVQLERITSGWVMLRKRSSRSLDGILAMFAEEEQNSDFMEAWLDGFASGDQLGRGLLTSAAMADAGLARISPYPEPGLLDRLEMPLVRMMAGLGRPVARPAIQAANTLHYWGNRAGSKTVGRQRSLIPYTYWPSAAFAGYHAMFPQGVETFQAFVPKQHAKELFTELLQYTQKQGCLPIWCVIKQHRRDPFLLSYQVDGFSLELNYQRTRQTAEKLKQVLQAMIAIVIEAGGRFYLAKDHFLTHAQYRQSVGEEAVTHFLRLKQCYDPEALLQSDLYRRVFKPSLA